jgi:uncharacterized protein
MLKYTERDGTITFQVRVVPRASKSSIVGTHDGILRIRVSAPPVNGSANEESLRIISKALDVSVSRVEIIRGQTSKIKTIKVSGVAIDKLKEIAGVADKKNRVI